MHIDTLVYLKLKTEQDHVVKQAQCSAVLQKQSYNLIKTHKNAQSIPCVGNFFARFCITGKYHRRTVDEGEWSVVSGEW
jgi:hypothetical protein